MLMILKDSRRIRRQKMKVAGLSGNLGGKTFQNRIRVSRSSLIGVWVSIYEMSMMGTTTSRNVSPRLTSRVTV